MAINKDAAGNTEDTIGQSSPLTNAALQPGPSAKVAATGSGTILSSTVLSIGGNVLATVANPA